mmetsp:Transcript_32941/g.72261  ORF Transcript_32941/g.72261 Transcript_32941/m.72261 type:complete len:214 (-) Transcript_32941:2134-2775(-)
MSSSLHRKKPSAARSFPFSRLLRSQEESYRPTSSTQRPISLWKAKRVMLIPMVRMKMIHERLSPAAAGPAVALAHPLDAPVDVPLPKRRLATPSLIAMMIPMKRISFRSDVSPLVIVPQTRPTGCSLEEALAAKDASEQRPSRTKAKNPQCLRTSLSEMIVMRRWIRTPTANAVTMHRSTAVEVTMTKRRMFSSRLLGTRFRSRISMRGSFRR